MKMTIENAINASQCLMQFGQKELPFQVALVIANNQRVLQDVGKEYEKRRLALVDALGEKDEETGKTNVTPQNQRKFQDEITAIVEEEIELDLQTIAQDKLGDDFKIDSNSLVYLQWLFV